MAISDGILHVRIPHHLYALLRPGIRDQRQGGEQILFAEDETGDLVVTDVLGKFPVRDLNSETITTDPEQSGQRVEIDSDGIRLIDSADEVLANLPTDENSEPTFAGYIAARGMDIPEGTDSPAVINQVRWLDGSGTNRASIDAYEDTGTGEHILEVSNGTFDNYLLTSSGKSTFLQLARTANLALDYGSATVATNGTNTAAVTVSHSLGGTPVAAFAVGVSQLAAANNPIITVGALSSGSLNVRATYRDAGTNFSVDVGVFWVALGPR